jgi:hypothetical protein
MTKPKSKITQLRLLLPAEWLPEIDNLAATRFLSRLGFLRFLIRSGMNNELANLAEHFKQTEQQKKTHKQLQQRRQDKEW